MAETVELLNRQYATMVSTWDEPVYLTRRKSGTFTLKVHRCSVGEPGYSYVYRSEPFRAARAFLDALKEAESTNSIQDFSSDLEAMLEEVETLDARLASEARLLLKTRAWCDWDPDLESHRVVMHDLTGVPR